MTERALLSARATDPDDVFRTECLCQWVEAVIESAFPEGSWEAGMDSASSIAEDSELTFAADMSADRETTSLAVCGKRADGKWHVELIAVRKGFAWLTEWLRVRCQDEHVRLSYQGRGAPICSHIGDLEAIDGLELKPCEGANLGAWSGRFYDAVCACNGSGDAIPLMHRPQPALDHAAKIAQTKPMGDSSWAWNRQGSVDDISPLVACTFAFGLATENDKTEQGRVYESAYETRSLLII